VTHTLGQSDGLSEVLVVDPSMVTGDTYTINFTPHVTTTPDTTIVDSTNVVWSLTNSAGSSLLSNQVQLSSLTESDAQPIVDGLKVKVSGPPAGINPSRIGVAYGEGSGTSATYLQGWDFSGTRWISGRSKGWIGLFGGLGNGSDWWGTTLTSGGDYMDVEIRFAGCETCTATDTTSAMMMAKSKVENPDRWSKAASYAGWLDWSPRLADAPFSAWDVESVPERRLAVTFVEDGEGNLIWDMGWDGSACR
jgi:hypothetical protein